MPPRFSPSLLDALTDAITGGASGSTTPSIGIYRSATPLQRFFAQLDVELNIGSGSRVPVVLDTLKNLNATNPKKIIAALEAVVAPENCSDEPAKATQMAEALNRRLEPSGHRLILIAGRFKFQDTTARAASVDTLTKILEKLDSKAVQHDFEKAIERTEKDPTGALTSACSLLESVFKNILLATKTELPSKETIQGLRDAVNQKLELTPMHAKSRPSEYAEDIVMVLQGLSSVVQGIGSLRTHAGDAHGRSKPITIDGRIARLAIHTASTMALFYIETWQWKSNAPSSRS